MIKKIKTRIRDLVAIFRSAGEAFQSNLGFTHAAAIAYYILISSIPLLILVISATGVILGSSDEAARQIFGFVERTIPHASLQIAQILEKIIVTQKVTRGIGIIGLLWSGSQIFLVIEEALAVSWRCPKRGWIKRRLMCFAVALCLGLFPPLSVLLTLGSDAVKEFGQNWLPFDISKFGVFLFATSYGLPILLSTLGFFLVFKVLPHCWVRWQCALGGGFVAAVLFEIAKHVFSLYLTRFATLDKLYGPITGIVVIIIWAQYGAIVTIFGGEFSHAAQNYLEGRAK